MRISVGQLRGIRDDLGFVMTAALIRLLMIIVVASLVLTLSADASVADRTSRMTIGGAEFLVVTEAGELNVTRAEVNAYVADAARAVMAYYGSFPVDKTIVRIAPIDDDGVGFATSTFEDAGGYGLIELDLGRYADRRDLDRSWTLTHEMMHLAFPIVARRHRWLAEGIATYAEPIGRMRTGKLSREEVWGDLAKNLDKGLSGTDGGGLNSAQGYGRIYWGGALYCLLADVEIRRRTSNRAGLEDALKAICRRGGNASSDWSAEKAIDVGDAALGTAVLRPLYDQMSKSGANLDVRRYLEQLGVRRQGNLIVLDDRAPLAPIRQAIEGRMTD